MPADLQAGKQYLSTYTTITLSHVEVVTDSSKDNLFTLLTVLPSHRYEYSRNTRRGVVSTSISTADPWVGLGTRREIQE